MTDPDSSTVIGARATTFFRLLRSGLFKVPWHQRRYDWTADHVEELLQDIDDAINDGRRCYFLGTMILVDCFSLMFERTMRVLECGRDREAAALGSI